MATKIFGVSDCPPQKYRAVEEYPWDELEEKICVKLDTAARQQIFKLRIEYFDDIAAAEQATPVREVEELRKELMSAAQRLWKFRIEISDSIQKERAFHHLVWYRGGAIRDSFDAATESALQLLNDLSMEADGFALKADVREPRVFALKCLVGRVVATQPDRAEPLGKAWGVGISGGSNPLVRLLAFITERDLSPNDVKNAIKAARISDGAREEG